MTVDSLSTGSHSLSLTLYRPRGRHVYPALSSLAVTVNHQEEEERGEGSRGWSVSGYVRGREFLVRGLESTGSTRNPFT
jgi:hypothetical protein